MTRDRDPHQTGLSRRGVLRDLLAVGGVGVLLTAATGRRSDAAARKLSQKMAGYQPTPKGKQRCDNCAQWQTPAGCKVVDGDIAAAGWCNLYAPGK